jgi:hypothetical protein
LFANEPVLSDLNEVVHLLLNIVPYPDLRNVSW